MTKRVGLIGKNSLEFVEHLLAIWKQGNCAVLIDWRMPLDTGISLLGETGAEKCYIESRFYIEEIANRSAIEFQCFDNYTITPVFLSPPIFGKYSPNYSENEAVIIFSSGTTGKSKGIRLSFRALTLNADYIAKNQGILQEDCLLIVRSFVHASGLVGDLLVALQTKARALVGPTVLHPRYALYVINKYNATRIGLVPTLLAAYLQEIAKTKIDLPSLRMITVSGALLLDKWVLLAKELIPNAQVFNQYGLSEAGPRVTAQTKKYCARGSVGVPVDPGVEVQIVDKQQNLLPYGEIGFLYVKTPSLCSGYVSGRRLQLMEDGWLNTNDLAYMHRNGEIFVLGRADDVINTKASLVYPSDVEAVILQVKGIRECVVFGYPDDVYGEIILCYYTVEDDTKDIFKKIRAQCKAQLMEHERPKAYFCVPGIPKGNTGKISRKRLAALHKERGTLHG